MDVAVTGSRCRGLEHEGSDLDVVVELSTAERELSLIHICNGFALSGKESKMAKNNKADMSCARVKKYTASDVSKAERPVSYTHLDVYKRQPL